MQTTETMTGIVNAPGAPEFITIEQAAGELEVTPWAVVQRIEAGELSAARFGTLTLVSRADLEPATAAGLAVVAAAAEGLGFTLLEVAARCGLDRTGVNELTSGDESLMARTVGTMLAERVRLNA